jgi:DNA-binding transcriptional ArsR family regulator
MKPDRTDAILRALAEPRRRAILELVSATELAAGEIAAAFDGTRPAVCQHLALLKDAGLVSERRDGSRRLYRAEPDGFADFHRYLDQLWAPRSSEVERSPRPTIHCRARKKSADDTGRAAARETADSQDDRRPK